MTLNDESPGSVDGELVPFTWTFKMPLGQVTKKSQATGKVGR